jgi:hypothetical protein
VRGISLRDLTVTVTNRIPTNALDDLLEQLATGFTPDGGTVSLAGEQLQKLKERTKDATEYLRRLYVIMEWTKQDFEETGLATEIRNFLTSNLREEMS